MATPAGDAGEARRFRASAPARLDFAGGWTDVAPFAVRERGVVVNGAIDLFASAEVELGGDRLVLQSAELDDTLELPIDDPLEQDGRLDLLKAALRLSPVGPCALRTRSDAPPGSGLGSSGALDVALVASLDAVKNVSRSETALAEAAFHLESVEAALPGGKQDQYAAALGGFHRLGFENGAVTVEPLPLDPAFRDELAARTVVCYTGTSRLSSRTIARVMDAYARGEAGVVRALHGLVETAGRMAEALSHGDLAGVARLLTENWGHQQRLDRGMATDTMKRLEEAMRHAGAMGGKAAGAGAGGSMFFLASDPIAAASAARGVGARVLDFTWALEGVRVE
ncbi:MAG: hypothetical protein ACRENB_07155, partial [Gemmatimonadales bacterium]